MNQDDFRRMLSSRETTGDKQSYGGKRNLTEADLADIKKLSAKKAKKKSKKQKNATHGNEDEVVEHFQPKNAYRDRAAERRSGGTGDMIDANEYKHFNTEQSKFLGGDMKHTHLVKGLDYALLAQLKREKQKLLAEKKKHVESGAAVGVDVVKKAGDEIDSIPVSVQRSKEDCPEPDEVISGIVDEALIDRVAEIMTSKTSGKKMRKKKHKQHHHDEEKHDEDEKQVDNDVVMPEAEIEVVDEEDEDIFADVGEYVPVDQRTDDVSADASKKEDIKKAGYFSNLSASITEKEEAARKKEKDEERKWQETLQKAVDTQKKVEREKERKAKEAKMIGEDDYAEYQGIGALVGDSDEEDDEETARRRKAAGLTKRKDDPDPEEKARRKQQKHSSKLANDLEKINKVRLHHSMRTSAEVLTWFLSCADHGRQR
ncbi:Transmembrane protein [Phytophthora megakarya]|uniref:Transmembrane protein n=1 Tax=Phytophthora megakarya TaxID=4795 RepID=A0A225UWC2_9STRA|nr:Transmembrane protein [Phytophthora megakarya]